MPISSRQEASGCHPLAQEDQLLCDDAAALGLEMISQEDRLASILTQLPPAVGASVASHLASQPNSLEEVQVVAGHLRTLSTRARDSGALSDSMAEELHAAVRTQLFSSYGTRHEDSAVQLYSRQQSCVVRPGNRELLLWRFPREATEWPAPLLRSAIRPRSRHRPPRRLSACAEGCSCRRLRAIDRCRAALAVERGEQRWWLLCLRLVDREAHEAEYRCALTGEWDALGLMSDLRIARGRAKLMRLRAETQARGGGSACKREREAGGDAFEYCHGGDRWDLFGLADDLRIARRRNALAEGELQAAKRARVLEELHTTVSQQHTCATGQRASPSDCVLMDNCQESKSHRKSLHADACRVPLQPVHAAGLQGVAKHVQEERKQKSALCVAGLNKQELEQLGRNGREEDWMPDGKPSFFYIAGAVDGIAEVLVCTHSEVDWS